MTSSSSSEKIAAAPQRRMTEAEWNAEGERRFGTDRMKWRFVCPSCGYIASVQEWKDAGAGSGAVAFSCVGRWLKKCSEAFLNNGGPCNYAGGGLFKINPVLVAPEGSLVGNEIFDFAPDVAAIVGGRG